MFVNRKSVLLIMTANASEVVVFCLTLSVQKLTTTENMKCATDQYFLDSFQTVDHMHVSRQIVHMLGGGGEASIISTQLKHNTCKMLNKTSTTCLYQKLSSFN